MRPDATIEKRLPALTVALVLSAGMLAAGLYAIEGLTIAHIAERIVLPMGRLVLSITAGLVVGQAIEFAGWTHLLGALGAPLFRFGRLGPHCSAAFTTAFVSGEAANAMLLGFWKEGRIDRSQLALTYLANQMPAFFLHLPTTVFIVIPLTHWAGGIYFIISFLAALLRLLTVLWVGRRCSLRSTAPTALPPDEGGMRAGRGMAALWKVLKRKMPGRLVGVAIYVVPVYIGVFLLNSAGFFECMRQMLTKGFAAASMPIEAYSLVVLSFTAEFTSGFAAAGALLKESVLSTRQIVIALLLGNIAGFPIRALRHQLPRLLGIFGPKLGMMLLLSGQVTRVLSMVIVGGLYWAIF